MFVALVPRAIESVNPPVSVLNPIRIEYVPPVLSTVSPSPAAGPMKMELAALVAFCLRWI